VSTIDDITPLALGGRTDYVAMAKMAAKVLAVLVTAILSAVTAYKTATSDAAAQVQASKNKSEAGYQITKEAMEELQHRVLVLEQAAHRAETDAHLAAHKGKPIRKPAPPPAVVVTASPKPLPADLDKAERQIYKGASPAAAPALDGGTGGR
jgi:hypothetical protein